LVGRTGYDPSEESSMITSKDWNKVKSLDLYEFKEVNQISINNGYSRNFDKMGLVTFFETLRDECKGVWRGMNTILAEFLGDPNSSEWKKLLADEYLVPDEIKEIEVMAQECIANAYLNCGGRKL
jgi:hypothetical protein